MAAAATMEAPPASTAAGKTPLSLGYTMPGKLNKVKTLPLQNLRKPFLLSLVHLPIR